MSGGMAGVIAAHQPRYLMPGDGEDSMRCDCGGWQGDVVDLHAEHVAEELAKAGYGDVRDAPRAVHYAGNVRQTGYTGRPEGWTSAQWHESAWGDTGEGYSLPGRLYVVQCAWCPEVFIAHTKKEAVALYRSHEATVLGEQPTTSPAPAQDARELLARDVFTASNPDAPAGVAESQWAMIKHTTADGKTPAHAVADALLARGWTRHREIDGAELASFTGYACIVKKGAGVVFTTWDGKQWESPGSYTGYTTAELAADGPYLVLLEGETA